MSVQHNTYVLYGVIIRDFAGLTKTHQEGEQAQDDLMEPYSDDAFKPDVNAKRGITILSDGMCGKYVAIGRVIAKTEVYQPFTDAPISIPTKDDDLCAMVRASVTETLADLGWTDPVKFGWHVLTFFR